MKLRMVLALVATVAVVGAAPARVAHAQPYGHQGWGAYDEHHRWHDANWWHVHRPGWVWQYHPEWVQHYPQWRLTDGDYDNHHHWHDRNWWYKHDPRWVEAHHPQWQPWHN